MVIFVLALVAFCMFAVSLRGFSTPENLLTLCRNVAAYAIVGSGLAVAVIGGGIDLSVLAISAVAAAWAVVLSGHSSGEPIALVAGLLLVLVMGFGNGLLICFADIPPMFATLATGILFFGLGQFILIKGLIVRLPASSKFIAALGQSHVADVPTPVIIAISVMALTHLFLKYVRWGRFVFAIGDNAATARLTGIGVRRVVVGQYCLAAVIAYIAGLVLVGENATFSLSIANGGMLYDVITIVVLGGISLSGGVGGIGSVLAGTVLIGTLLNGMTIMDLPQEWQNLAKGAVLLLAVVLDSALHPRSDVTGRQGDL